MHRIPGILFILLILVGPIRAQDKNTNRIDPKIAFLKSLAVPGWGHYYVNHNNWNRGQYHLAAEAGLILGYLGLSIHSDNLRQNWLAYGRSEAGVPLEGRSREFRLAVGNFNSLEEYNSYQRRSRNWDKLFDDRPENRWQWSGDEERFRYTELRDRFENIDRQLPAILGMMVANRIISGISAYNRAGKAVSANHKANAFYLSSYRMGSGILANVKIHL